MTDTFIDHFFRWMIILDPDWHRKSRVGLDIRLIRSHVGPYVRRVWVDSEGRAVAVAYVRSMP